MDDFGQTSNQPQFDFSNTWATPPREHVSPTRPETFRIGTPEQEPMETQGATGAPDAFQQATPVVPGNGGGDPV